MSASMGKFSAFLSRVRAAFHGRKQEDEFNEEIREHLQLLTETYVQQGMNRVEAAAAARRQFGNSSLLQEECRSLRTFEWLAILWQDLRFAGRTLWKSRMFAALVIAILGLGIGAATAIFSVIDNVLLEPFPYKGADRIASIRIHGMEDDENGGRQGYTSAEYLELAENNRVFEAISAASEDLVTYRNGKGADQLYGARVTPGTFEFFGMPALHGRVLQPNDYEPGAPPVFVMRYKTWRERFNGDSAILNKTFILNGVARNLVGVMPPRFGWYEADVLIPEKPVRENAGGPGTVKWFVVGRVRRGLSKQQAEADLALTLNAMAKIRPKDYPAQFSVQLVMLGEGVVGSFRATLYTVLAAVGLLLLIACGNVANLMLARATTRESEIALRSALGAGRGRLIRLLLVESIALATAAAMVGVLLAWGGLKLLVAGMPPNLIPTETVIALNGPVLAFTACLSALTALVFGLVPALGWFKHNLNASLRDGGKNLSDSSQRGWMRNAVVVAEVALSLALLVGAGLLMRSFAALREVHLGIHADHIFQTVLILPDNRYATTEEVAKFVQPLMTRLKATPGVLDAAESSRMLPSGGVPNKVEIVGQASDGGRQTTIEKVSEEYFRVLQVELKQGRNFSDVEESEARRVAVVNEVFAQRYLSDGRILGRRLRLGPASNSASASEYEVIGVAGNVTNNGLQNPTLPQVWIPMEGAGPVVLLVRTSQEPESVLNEVQQAVWATDSDVALIYPGALVDQIDSRLYAGPRFGAVLTAAFGGVGLILVIAGVYSVLAYSTVRRTQEIGIRMALGAERASVLRMVVRGGLRLVLTGVAIGIALSLAVGRMIGAELIGVTAYDPTTLLLAPMLVVGAAAIACWIPARKAASVDPTIALRYQ